MSDPYVPPQDWTGGPEWANGPSPLVNELARMAIELERQQANEETPLSLTPKQLERLWVILRDEAGPAAAVRILKRVEEEA